MDFCGSHYGYWEQGGQQRKMRMCEAEKKRRERGPGYFHIMPQTPLTGMWVAAGQIMLDTVTTTWPGEKLEGDAGPKCVFFFCCSVDSNQPFSVVK